MNLNSKKEFDRQTSPQDCEAVKDNIGMDVHV